ncbi:MAG: hypothetical protein H7X97_11350, partial [Opitutaceae bacterium]|nr:hypothetical protein [Verrucomicrobiales bacterium]
MKRLFLLCLVGSGLLSGRVQAADQAFTNDTTTLFYYNNGTSLDSPPIDAINFINNGTFIATNAADIFSISQLPFETSSTLNYTNTGTMQAVSSLNGFFQLVGAAILQSGGGFRFQNNPSGSGVARASRSFHNDNNATVNGGALLSIWATNIVNRGTMTVDGTGKLELTGGGRVDLAESRVIASGLIGNDLGGFFFGSFTINTNFFIPDQGIYDLYWSTTNLNFSPFDLRSLWQPVQIGGTNYDVATAPAVFGINATQPFFILPFSIPVFGSNFVTGTNQVIGTNVFTQTPFFGNTNLASNSKLIAASETNFLDMTTITVTNIDLVTTADVSVPSNVVKQAVFVCVPNEFNAQIGFQNFFGSFKTVSVLLSVTTTNPVTALLQTNTLFFEDALAGSPGRGLLQNFSFPGFFRPTNYLVQRMANFFGGFDLGFVSPGNAGFPKTNFFLSTGSMELPPYATIIGSERPPGNFVTNGVYSAYSAFIDNVATRPPNVAGGTFTNVPGRVKIEANNLDLNDALISAGGYVSIKAKHLISSTNLFVDCDSVSLDVGSTNGTLVVEDLSSPSVVGRLRGPIRAWSALWTNVVEMLITNNYGTNGFGAVVSVPVTNNVTVVYHALILDASALASVLPTLVYDLAAHAENVIIKDDMTVVQKVLFDARSLTLEGDISYAGAFPTNPATGFSSPGTPVNTWSAATAPRLLYFTNLGTLRVPSAVHFGDDRPRYNTFVNGGTINAASIQVNSLYVENRGILNSRGVIEFQFNNALLANGTSSSSNSTRFVGNHLAINNYNLTSGGRIDFNVGSILTDQGVASTLRAGSGINLNLKPTFGDLTATTITDFAPNTGPATIQHTWAGEDRGPVVGGFVDNVVVGRLVIDAVRTTTKFRFAPAGPTNALYVDRLELGALIANADTQGNLTNFIIDRNMTIYFGDATVGGVSIAEKLNGKFGLNGINGGKFVWVPSYAGTFSGIDLDYGGTTYRFNRALTQSQNIDSDFNTNDVIHVVNAFDPTPISSEFAFTNVVSMPVLPTLAFPTDAPSGGPGFAGAKGSYNGLFYDQTGLDPASSGYFSATTTDKGQFSAKVQWAGRAYSFSGKFNSAGQWTGFIPKSPLEANLQIDLGGDNRIGGTISDGEWVAEVVADRLIFNKKSNRAPQA